MYILINETEIWNEEENAPAALDSAQRARVLAERHHTPDEAIFTHIHLAAGVAQVAGGDTQGARREFEAMIAGTERRFGPDHPRVADALVTLSTVEIADGHYDVAAAELDRAVAIDSTSRGAGHVNTAIYLLDRAQANHRRGAWEKALADAERATKLYVDAQGPDFPDLMITDTIAADCHRALGHAAEATRDIEEAERIASLAKDPGAEAVAEMRFVHARILADKDPRRALALAEQAAAHFAADANTEDDRAQRKAVLAWLEGAKGRR
jgi:tetratricopeptide (TPR) repeat protein